MRFFADTANLDDVTAALRHGFQGITTNPSILAKEPQTDFLRHIQSIISRVRDNDRGAAREWTHQAVPLSVEVFASEPREMVSQARQILELGYAGLVIKVPIGWAELEVIRELSLQDIPVNCTCVMTVRQALMAAAAGASYVSFFWNRIKDGYVQEQRSQGCNPPASDVDCHVSSVVQLTRSIFERDGLDTQIIVGSIRHVNDVAEAFMAGADIVTVPPRFWPELCQHPKTDEAVQQFLTDFQAWLH